MDARISEQLRRDCVIGGRKSHEQRFKSLHFKRIIYAEKRFIFTIVKLEKSQIEYYKNIKVWFSALLIAEKQIANFRPPQVVYC